MGDSVAGRQSYFSWCISIGGMFSQLACVFCLGILGLVMTEFCVGINTTPADAAILASFYGIAYGGCGLIWGLLADKIGVRFTLTIAGAGAALTMILFGLMVADLTSAMVIFTINGIFVSGLSSAILPKLVQTWFHSSWLGKSLAVITFGGTMASVICGFLVPWLVMGWGWQGAFIGAGFCVACFTVIMFLLVRNDPTKLGIIPFGTPKDELDAAIQELEAKEATGEIENKPSFKDVIRNPYVWKMALLWTIYNAGMYADGTYQTTALVSFGLTLVAAGAVASAYRFAQTAANFIWGIIGDILARKYSLFCMGLLSGILFIVNGTMLSTTGNMIFGESTPVIMMVILGLTYAFVPLLNSQMSDLIEPRLVGTASGLALTISLIGTFFGPLIAAAISTSMGTWTGTFYFSGACSIIVGVLAVVLLPKTGGKKYGAVYKKNETE